MAIENLLIHYDKTLIDALHQLNQLLEKEDLSRAILFVIDAEDKILGSITDGDIRRSILEKKNLSQKVIDICNKDFIFARETNDYLDLQKYREKDIKILPIIDSNQKLTKILDLDQMRAQLPIDCMLMAGGRGKRLSPLTDKLPKPMLKVAGKPIIEHIIDRLISFGITRLYISVRYLAEQIQEYFGDGTDKGIEIKYINEGIALGTAGSLSLVQDFRSEEILLMNSDILTNADFEKMYLKMRKSKADITIASKEHEISIPYAVIKSNDQKVVSIKEKPTINLETNAGIYLLKRKVLELIPKGEYFDVTDLFEKVLSVDGNISTDLHRGYWIDIGNIEDYKAAQDLVKRIEI